LDAALDLVAMWLQISRRDYRMAKALAKNHDNLIYHLHQGQNK
jgi:hypothetical protein